MLVFAKKSFAECLAFVMCGNKGNCVTTVQTVGINSVNANYLKESSFTETVVWKH